MERSRSIAIWVAVLFVIGTAASVAGDVFLAPFSPVESKLAAIAENQTKFVSAFMLFLIASSAIIAIPIVMFPILRLHSVTGSLLYVAARLVEGTFFLLGALLSLSLVPLAREASENSSTLALIEDLGHYSYTLGTMIVFSLSAIVLAVMLYQTRLVPRWLSMWKGLGAVLLLAQGLLTLFETITPFLEQSLYLPIAVNEMVFALWLAAKGFSPTALITLQGKSDPR